ncbi:hypothetical protein TSUD_89930 [Trifolium subterraneum]|uniref:TF-B3 domain-containing protein n=1 Tax=Trifolium subterraneum TaxID=3900 RepID=A0A2Z6NTB1_TRISU|nr:hypothetical protein TSUD_89930 [Trifolium subterraneum]
MSTHDAETTLALESLRAPLNPFPITNQEKYLNDIRLKYLRSLELVDECGNSWTCDLTLLTFPCKQFKIGGDWSRMVSARKLTIGAAVKIGAPAGGNNETIYFTLDA